MRYPIDKIRAYGVGIAKALGMNDTDAERFIDNLVMADCRGIHSHGFTKFHGYVERLEKGLTSPTAQPTIVLDHGACFVVDGNNGMGTTTATATMQWCIERAKQYGISMAAVRNASHYGFGGYFSMMAAEQDMIGLNLCDCPALVAPYGGAEPMLGTNPISMAIPAGEHDPLVMDMATSVVAKGKIALAMKEGRPIPEGWALDQEGRPTTDAAAANKGVLLPFAGAKGYALALIVDVLCASLAGALDSRSIQRCFENPTRPSEIGYIMMAVDISKFTEPDTFKARTDKIFTELKASAPAVGFSEVMIPGEPESRNEKRSRVEGVELADEVIKEMRAIGEVYGVQLPAPIDN